MSKTTALKIPNRTYTATSEPNEKAIETLGNSAHISRALADNLCQIGRLKASILSLLASNPGRSCRITSNQLYIIVQWRSSHSKSQAAHFTVDNHKYSLIARFQVQSRLDLSYLEASIRRVHFLLFPPVQYSFKNSDICLPSPEP